MCASQYTSIQTTLGPKNVQASVSVTNSALMISTHLIVSNQCDLCDVKSNASAPPAVLCTFEAKMWVQFRWRSRWTVQGRMGVRLRQAIKHQETSFPRLTEWDVGSYSVPTTGHPSREAFSREVSPPALQMMQAWASGRSTVFR